MALRLQVTKIPQLINNFSKNKNKKTKIWPNSNMMKKRNLSKMHFSPSNRIFQYLRLNPKVSEKHI